MGLEENVAEGDNKERWTLCKHTFYDLSNVSPVVFMFMLKECYYYGMNFFSLICNMIRCWMLIVCWNVATKLFRKFIFLLQSTKSDTSTDTSTPTI